MNTWPHVPIKQQKEGLRFVLRYVSKEDIAHAVGLLVYRKMATPKDANQVWDLIEEIEREDNV